MSDPIFLTMWRALTCYNWRRSNTNFDKARAQQPNGFVSNNTVHADYNTTVNSWIEQRTWVTAGPAVLAHDEPGLAHDLAVELDAISHPQVPSSETGFTEISTRDLTTPIHCDGGIEVQFGLDGSLTQLITKSGEPSWASLTNPLGQYRYQVCIGHVCTASCLRDGLVERRKCTCVCVLVILFLPLSAGDASAVAAKWL